MLDILCIAGVAALFALLSVVARAVERLGAPDEDAGPHSRPHGRGRA